MLKNKAKKTIALILAGAVVLPGASSDVLVSAKAKCAVKTMTLEKGQRKTIKIKKKVKGATYSFKSSKSSVAKVNKKGVVTAKKVGKAVITVTEKKKTKKKTVGKVTIKVKEKSTVATTEQPSSSPVTTSVPSPSASSATSAAPTATATATPAATPTVASSKPKSFIDENFEVPEEFAEELDGYNYAEPTKITYYSNVSQANRRALVYLPADYDANKEYPIMYLLHGIGGSEDEWKAGLPEYITGNLNKEGTIPQMIIVCPNQLVQVPGEAMPGNYLDPGRFVMFNRMVDELRTSLIPYMGEHYSIMEGRDNHAIAGLSMGGRT
ncbi:MAG: alpha/beta hydrolase-fold protein, partial [Eubacterium sp.]|nr:alpha/beta hydrolase-fold protein [Eubacterium sp.]